MSFITWHTRGNASALGKLKIWFCAHPDDVKQYLKPISENIYDINYFDWAIWYDKELSEDYDNDFFKGLGRMDLFVVPVTKKLLCEPNRAMDVEVPFAIENHIPILPLVQESGLIEQFNKKFHNLQYIDTADKDFKEKLKNYLCQNLTEGDLIDRVKGNFLKYIFLSYRKKDRAFVSKIMSGIHSRPCFRQVAIWFDDFLKPGENFDEQILEEIDQSDAILLLVTPNILEDNNYVLTCEYVEALKREKLILPVEAQETDDEEYRTKYYTLPKGVPIDNIEEILSILEKQLESIKDAKSSPESNYLLGLAYLNGIDVEKNYEYAVEFLQSAAAGGSATAMEKLSNMYIHGNGVAFSYSSAIYWKKALTQHYADVYNDLCDEKSAVNYIDSLRAYAKLFRDACMTEQEMESHIHRCRVCEEISSRFPHSFWFKRDLFEAYMAASQTYIAQGALERALEYVNKAQSIGESLDAMEGGVFNAYNTATTFAKLGEIHQEKGEYALARKNYHEAIKCAQKIVTVSLPKAKDPSIEEKNEPILPHDVERAIIHLITLCWTSLGDIAMEENNEDEAKYYYHDAERSLLGYSIGNSNLNLTDSIVYLFSRILKLYCAENNQYKAIAYCEKGLLICGVAKEDSWHPSLLIKGISLILEIEKTYEKYALIEKKNEAIRLRINLLEYLATKTKSASHLQEYCNFCGWYATNESRNGKDELANQYRIKAISVLQEYGEALPKDVANEYLYRFHYETSKGMVLCKDLHAAIDHSQKALELCSSGTLEDAESRLVNVYETLFDIYIDMGVTEKALEYIQKACMICSATQESCNSLVMKRKLSILTEKLAAFYLENEDAEQAREFMLYSASLSNEIFQVQRDAQSYDDLLHACICMMEISSENEEDFAVWHKTFIVIIRAYAEEFNVLLDADGDMLEEMVRKMVLAEEILLKLDSSETMYEILTVYSLINDLCAQLHVKVGMEESYKRIDDIGEQLLLIGNASNANGLYKILCHANKLMGQQWELSGHRDSAESCYLRAYEHAKARFTSFLSNESSDEYADILKKLGDLYTKNDIDKAIIYYVEAINLYKKMIAEYGEIYEKHNYAVTSVSLGKLYLSMGNTSLALSVYVDALVFLEKDIDMKRMYPRMEAIVLEKTADVYWEEQDPKWALYYKKALDIFEELYDAEPNEQTRHDLEIITERIASCHFISDDMDNAELYYLRLEKLQDLIYKREPGIRNLKKLKDTTGILAEIFEKRNAIETTVAYIEKLIKLCEVLKEHEPSEQAWFEYAFAIYKISIFRQDSYWLKNALRIFEKMKEHSQNQELYLHIIEDIRTRLSSR